MLETPTKRKSYPRPPEKLRARIMAICARRAGKLVRQPCEKCGVEQTDAHHDDYSKPLEVRWLCRAHHLELHRQQRTHCRRGHARAGHNLMMDADGHRRCRVCRRHVDLIRHSKQPGE